MLTQLLVLASVASIYACGVAAPAPASAPAKATAPVPTPPAGDAPRPSPTIIQRVVVTIPPLKGLVRATSVDGTFVKSLVTPGRSEHGFELSPSDLEEIARANVVVYVGLGLEPWLEKTLKDHPSPTRIEVCFAKVVGLVPAEGEGEPDAKAPKGASKDGTPEPTKQEMPETPAKAKLPSAWKDALQPIGSHDHDHDHDHGHGHDHAHRIDPHLWLDPELVVKFIPVLGQTLRDSASKVPNIDGSLIMGAAAREARLIDRAMQIDKSYRETLAPFAGRALVTQHNAFSRLAERYGFQIAATIHDLEAVEPTPGEIARVVKAIKEGGARAVCYEPQTNRTAARAIAAAAGVKLVELDPLGGDDWVGLMDKNLEALKSALGDEAPNEKK